MDANLLVYARSRNTPQHEAARRWLDVQLTGSRRVAMPWTCLLAFMRLLSNPRVVPEPEPVPDLWVQVRQWLAAPPVWIPQPTERHVDVLEDLMPSVTKTGLVTEAHLAALAIEHGLVLASADRGFGRFEGLRWVNPLAA